MRFKKFYIVTALCVTPVSVNAQNIIATGFGPAVTKPIAEDVQRITQAAGSLALSINDSTKNVVSSIHSSGAEANKAVMGAASKTSSDQLTTAQITLKLEMDFKAEIEAQKQKQRSKLINDETLASVKFIEEFLRREDIKNLNISDVIDFSKKQLDGKAIVVEPPAMSKPCKSGDKECEKAKKELKNVGFERKIVPSKHILAYLEMCSSEKMTLAKQAVETAAKNLTNIESAKAAQEALNKTDSKASQTARVKEQISLTCVPSQLEKGLCGDISKDAYIDKILKNEIIPNGSVSASNLYSPSSVGGAGVIDLNDPSLDKMKKLVAFDALEKTEGGKKDLPKIVHTYRNSSQLKAAEAFVDNIINLDAVANQPVAQRKQAGSTEFQSLYLTRAAQLDLAKNTILQSVAERRGSKLGKTSTSSLPQGEVVKEAQDGAGALDLKWHEIQTDMDTVSPANIDKLTAMAENQIWIEMYKSLVKKNRAQFDRMIRLERQSLLLSTILASQVNSTENINYLKTNSK